MAPEATPVLIAYDGSEISRSAVRHAAELFAGRPTVVATVWEPGLAAMPMGLPDTMGVGALPPDPDTVEAVDRSQHEHASTVAAEGAEFARSVGLAAEPQAVPDVVDVADTLIDIARERGAAVVVVGAWDLRAAQAPARKRLAEADRALRPARPRDPRRELLIRQR